MKISTTVHFAIVAVVSSIGWLGMLARFSQWSWLLIIVSFLFYPRDARDIHASRIWFWFRGVVMAAFIAAFFMAKSQVDPMLTVWWFILPVWLYSLWLMFSDWRKQRGAADA